MTDDELEFLVPDFRDDDIQDDLELEPTAESEGSDSGTSEGRPRRTSLVFGDLKGMLQAHRRWVESDGGEGQRANLQQGFLYQAKLSGVLLANADAQEAYLSEADLTGSNLVQANLAAANLERANLAGANLRGANLAGADLRGANLTQAVLLDTNLQDANLSEAQGVTEEQLAGANLAGATLPEGMTGLRGLKVVTEMWKNARLYFLTTLAASAYSWLTISTMTDVNLISKFASFPLPIIGIEIPTFVFYWAAPVLLLAFFVEFHRYTPRVFRELAKLPAVFPDARRLDEVFAPWPLAGLIRSHAAWLPAERSSWSRLRSMIEVMLGWWVVPFTLYLFWARLVPRHDLPVTALHVVLVAACVGFGFASYRGATETLRGEEETPFRLSQVGKGLGTSPRVAAVIGLAGVVFLSAAALLGWKPLSQSVDSRLQTTLRMIGYRAYADVTAQQVSTKLDGWTPGDTILVQAADLEGVDLRYARASAAFLGNANLRGANLDGAVLSSSNLMGSDLSNASLMGASLADVRLGGATLFGATLDSSDVRGADLQSVNLMGASLLDIRGWREIRSVTGANLSSVRNPPDGFLEWAFQNGAVCVESMESWSAVRRGEMEIPSPPSDMDVYAYCGVSGEQEAVAVAVLDISPAADTVRALGVIVQFEAVARDTSGNTIPGRIFDWRSSDTSVAAVDRMGKVVTVATGTTTIMATTGGVSSSAELTVSIPVVEGVDVPEAVATVEVIRPLATLTAVGDSVRLNAVARGSSGNPISGTAFIWTVSNSSVVTVNAAGFATAVANGSATITATTPDGVAGSVLLAVNQVTFTVEVTGEIDSILNDDTTRFTAIPRDANGHTVGNATVTWSSANTAVATVDSTGLVRGRARGSTTINAMSGPAAGGAALKVTALEFAAVTAGVWHTCALTVSGPAYCWGANSDGQLGDGSRIDRIMPVPVAGGVRFQALDSGHNDEAAHTCGLTAAGVPYCWGRNTSGRLGVGSTVAAGVPVQGGFRFAAVSAGFRHTCGVNASREAYCWGDNTLGALGDGTQRGSNSPVRVSGQLAFQSISAGGFFTCGVTVGGQAYCWGMNRSGQLGNGSTDQDAHLSPEPVRADVTFRSVAAALAYACGVSTSGEVYCWGANSSGQLGTGSRTSSALPVAVSGGLSFRMVSVGGHSCGITTGGEAYCWGANGSGQLGDGSRVGAGDVRAVPARVSGRLRFRSVSVGADHTCGVTTNRVVYCWGSNEHAKLGASTTETCSGRRCSRTPIRIRGQR